MKSANRSLFFCSLALSLTIMLTAIGLITVDEQGRHLTFGEETPAFQRVSGPDGQTSLKITLFGLETQVDITKIDEIFNFLLDFGCIPHN